jgi:3-oxoacyl-[acyl-carrier protein] reductase
MKLGLQGARFLVTAASSGLGCAIATELVREGCQIVISSRQKDRLDSAVSRILTQTGASSSAIHAITADVTNRDDIEHLVRGAKEVLGGLDGLVTNAGGPPTGRFEEITDEEWLSAFNLNLLSVVRLIRAALPVMQKQGAGKILNISSISVKQPIPNLILSNSIRTGTMAMLKTLAMEVAKDNIQVLNLAPGRIHTDRLQSLNNERAKREGRLLADIQAEEQQNIPIGRYGTPEEFAKLATFLLSPVNSFMTGQTILADGGVIRSL